METITKAHEFTNETQVIKVDHLYVLSTLHLTVYLLDASPNLVTLEWPLIKQVSKEEMKKTKTLDGCFVWAVNWKRERSREFW